MKLHNSDKNITHNHKKTLVQSWFNVERVFRFQRLDVVGRSAHNVLGRYQQEWKYSGIHRGDRLYVLDSLFKRSTVIALTVLLKKRTLFIDYLGISSHGQGITIKNRV